MKRFVLYIIGVCFACLPMSAQLNRAEAILERTVTAFQEAGGIKATFTVSFDGTPISYGSISLLGEKFVLEVGDTKIWFDGCTQWTYLMSADEVTISKPTLAELQSINPYAWLSFYKEGYKVSLTSEDNACYHIQMDAEAGQQMKSMALAIKRGANLPLWVSISQQQGGKLEIKIDSYLTKQRFSDNFFVFDAKKYPSAEQIDLR